MSFTADDAARVEFGNPPIGRRGYAKNEVDEFVRRIARTLAGEDDLTAAEVHHVEFGRPIIGRRGYDERQVDEFLDDVETELIDRRGLPPTGHQVPAARRHDQAMEPGHADQLHVPPSLHETEQR
jgi:DivIVA domain-containing protein